MSRRRQNTTAKEKEGPVTHWANLPLLEDYRNERGGWEITFCGFVLILLAFFIMLSSFSTMEEAKVTAFTRSFSEAVSILNGGLKFVARKDMLMQSADIRK